MSAPRNLQATATGSHAAVEHSYGLILAGRFRVEGLLGMGGMGVVYRAHDTHLDVPVALKMLRPELATNSQAFERFRQELLLARQVSSPHVVRIHDIAQHEGRWVISMDLVEGQSLEKLIDQRGPLPVDEAMALLRQMAEGLDAAHRRGVVHRDLKPANVLVDTEGNAYISDFGVARSLGASGLTHSGTVVGTPEYLSPEQARAERADQRSDLYSLGLIGYEMLTGTLPFAGGTPAESALQRIARAPPPVTSVRADVPAWAARVIGRLLRPSPAHRFQSARALIDSIDARRAPPEPWSAGARWVAAAVLLLVLAGSSLVWWAARPLPQETAVAPPAAQPQPSERLLVTTIATDGTAGDDSLAAALRGLSEHLRHWLGRGQPATADGERTAQVLALLGAERSTGTPLPEDVLSATDAHTVIAGRWVAEEADRGHLQFEIHRREQPVRTVRGETTSVDALSQAYASAGRALLAALELPASDPPALPADRQALAAFGAGLLARAQGDPPQAVQHYNEATVAAPQFVAAWVALADSARAAGRGEAALTAALNGLRVAGQDVPLAAARLEALRASLEGDPLRATQVLQALAEQRPGDAYVQLLLAEAESEAGLFQPSTERLQRLAAADPDDPRVWFLLGKVSILRGEARRAVDDYLVRALVLFNRSRNAVGQADTINALGVGYDRLGQIDQAIEQYTRAVELRRTLDDPRGLASSLRNLAALAAIRGEFERAEAHLAEARSLLEALRDRQGLADLDNDLGLLAEERGDFARALAHYRDALQQRQAIGHAHGIAESLNNVGYSHFQLGAYDNALVYWRQALDSFEALGDRTGIVRTRQNLGQLDIARGDWATAEQALEASLAEAEREQMVEEAAVSVRHLAELALLRGHSARALQRLERAEALFAGREDQRGLLDVRLLRARAALVERRFADATALLSPALEQEETLSDGQAAELLLAAAQAALGSGDAGGAAVLQQRAGQRARASGVPLLQLQAQLLASRLAGGRGDALDEVLAQARDMGNVPLLLRALAARLEAAADAPPAAAEASIPLYREALAVLRRVGDYGEAARLHAAAAAALGRAGATDAAREAADAAEAARTLLASGAVPPSQGGDAGGD